MEKNDNSAKPDYKRIYKDIINMKFPDKMDLCKVLFEKEILSTLDIIILNKIVFGINDENNESINNKYKVYSRQDIYNILKFQKTEFLNNTQLAKHFKMSRNTITKWKKMYRI
ncbi:transposase [Chryseobacterium viscerum]|uniref:Transposase n=1 Tax=Chryseobacterium viscerum TaxID=1037377 RepID=A0A316W9E9_9FLAO|nr:transposase [Chryseobacterium viscerum]PWN57924.1 transposase [Chryseobacterium viscerum]